MRYLFGTGLVGALTTGVSLLRGSRQAPITWRSSLAWVSWGITLALAIGSAVDMSRLSRGKPISDDSPLSIKQAKEAKKAEKKSAKRR